LNPNNLQILETGSMKMVPALLAFLGALVCAPTDHADTGRCPAVVDRTMSYAIGIAVIPAGDGVSGTYAFTGAGEVLKVVDVSDPAHPALAGRLILPDTITAIAARENHLYVWTGTRRLNVIDARIPEDPRLAGWIDLEGVSQAFSKIEVAGDHVFIWAGSSWGRHGIESAPGFRVIDVSNPDAPEEVARVEGTYASFAVSGSTLAVLTNEADAGWRVDLFDVSDPAEPALLGSYRGAANEFPQDVMVDGAFVYVSSYAGLAVIDFSDPTNPILAGTSDALRLRLNSALSEGHIYTHVASIFEVVDVRDPRNPVLCGTCETPWTYGEPEAMEIVGGLVFISHAYQGLVVVDVSDPSNPAVIGQLTEGFGEDAAVAGRYAIRLQSYFRWPSISELRISDLGSPGGPSEIGRYETDWVLTRLAVAGSSAYLLSPSDGVEVVDIGDPTAPRQVGRLETAYFLIDIAVNDDLAYLAVDRRSGGCDGLQIVDLGNPAGPAVVRGSHTDYLEVCGLGAPKCVAASGSYAYLGGKSALAVIDISDPSAPYEVARLATPAHSLAIERDHAYVAAGVHGLRVYDVRVPTAPQLVSELVLPETFWGPDEAGAITVAGRRVYLGSSRLQVIDISDPGRPHGLWDYPRQSDLTHYWLESVSNLAVAGSRAFLAQSPFGSTILDISGCREPRRDHSLSRFENP
jgi:hypothetical protein